MMSNLNKITYRQWRTNLWLYISGAVSAYIASSVVAVDFSQIKHVMAFCAGSISSGVIAAKAYIGRASEIDAPIEKEKTLMSTGPK